MLLTHIQGVFEGEKVTLVACVCSDGQYMPSALIYTQTVPTERYFQLIPDGWTIIATDSRYINEEIFFS